MLYSESAQGLNIYQQLIIAQKAIFEGELFDQYEKHGITLVENEILVQIYEGVDLTIQWANIDSIKKASSLDDAWTSNIHMYHYQIQLLKQQECVLNWTRGTPRERVSGYAEKGGPFCPEIFGPDGNNVRRWRIAHISLVYPVTNTSILKGVLPHLEQLLGVSSK
ncbi:39739_t:CDS:2, partial [Gigaspora margarita]